MKPNNLIVIIFLIFICLTTICKSQQLPTNQLNEAIKIIEEIHIVTITDPCGQYSNYFTCVPINDGTGSDALTVTSIMMDVNPATNPMTTDYTVFKNLTFLSLGSSIKTEQNIMNIIPQLVNITELSIGQQTQEIDALLQMPPKLIYLKITVISVPLTSSIFSTGILSNLEIFYPLEGFKYPTQFPSNSYLKYLTVVQTYYSGFPSNTGEAFTNLVSLTLTVHNDNLGPPNYVNQVFPTFTSYNKLGFLDISFNNEASAQPFNFEKSITTIPNLSELRISGKGFINPTNSTVYDFSNVPEGFTMKLQNSASAFIGDCTSSCLLLPKDTALDMQYCRMDLSKINYSNITMFSINSNDLEQPLPVDTINFPRVNSFRITSSSMAGTIPEEYCKFPINVLSLGENKLVGEVPSCFLCYGGDRFDIFPNQFTNFDEETVANCPTFKIDNYNKIVKTDGTTTLTITGKDFGFTQPDEIPIPARLMKVNVESPILTITVSNTEMTLWFPQGVVGSGTNLSFPVGFSLESLIKYTFNYSYEEPVIHGYSLDTIEGEEVFVLNGTGFNYVLANNITINGFSYSGEPNSPSMGGSLMRGSYNPLSALTVGNSFTVSVTVGGQTSKTRTFYLYKSLSLVNPTTKLLSYGGSLDLTGSFSTATKDNVEVYINGIPCTVTSVSPMTVKFDYPSSTQGTYQLRVYVGGYNLYSSVEYITAEKPSESSSEEVSLSTKLSVPFTCFFIILILSLL